MSPRDLVEVSFRNLWRTKLRTTLTTAGVVIAIATFVSMLSFAAGNQRYFTTAFNEFGLLSQMSVRAPEANAADTSEAVVLDADAVRRIAQIPGVRLAYPYSTFDVTATVLDTTVSTTARSLPLDAVHTKLFTKVLGGTAFASDTASEVIVLPSFVEQVGTTPDSILGQEIIVSMRVASLDSALVAAVGNPRLEAQRLYRSVDRDSIFSYTYRRRFIRQELADRSARFVEGLMNRQRAVSETLRVTGVAPDDSRYRFTTSPLVIPDGVARRLSSQGLVLDGNAADLLLAAREGKLFPAEETTDARSYPRVTLELDPLASHAAVKDSIEALGYRATSFAEQFQEMQRFMIYFYLGLGVVGLIALATASLGIINTLVMSINERRREIGVLKSLGAHEGDIQQLFLVESAVIGAMGSAVGVVTGWVATRIVARVATIIMEREEMPVFDPFWLPPWLILVALALGIAVSVAAGLYPATRAARVDPVAALRTE